MQLNGWFKVSMHGGSAGSLNVEVRAEKVLDADSSRIGRGHLELWEEEEQRPPPIPLKMVCEPDADYLPWRDDVPWIEVG